MLVLMFQASLVTLCVETKLLAWNCDAFVNFVGASHASGNIVAVLRRFCYELSSRFQLPVSDVVDDYTYAVIRLCFLLVFAVKVATENNLFVLDVRLDQCFDAVGLASGRASGL